MGNLTIQIGQGENKTINFQITTNQFKSSDTILFAVKTDATSRKQIITTASSVPSLDLDDGVYTFVVTLTSEQTRALAVRTYYYDLTLIDEYGQAKPLMKPEELIVCASVGASAKWEEV